MGKVGVRSSPFDLLSPGMILYVGTLVPTSDGCNGPANVTFVLALLHNYSMTIAADLADEY